MAEPAFEDDPSIRNDDRLLRRVHVTQLVKDDDTGLARVSSGVFRDRELSVNIESTLLSDGEGIDTCLRHHKGHKLICVTAGDARRFEQAVCHDHLPDDNSHGLIVGSKNKRIVHDGLRTAAAWVIPPMAPNYDDIEVEKRSL